MGKTGIFTKFSLLEEMGAYRGYLLGNERFTERSAENYLEVLYRIFRYFEEIGLTEIKDLTSEINPVLETWLMDKKLKPWSRRKYIRVFKSFCQYLKRHDKILFDPSLKLNYPQIKNLYRDVPTAQDVKALLDISQSNPRNYLIFALSFYLGTRAEELVSIQVSDIDLRKRSVLIHGKGGFERFTFFPEKLVEPLKEWIKGKGGHGLLFPNITANSLSKLVTYYFEKLSLTYSGAHELRRACATQLFEKGLNLVQIRDYLGHKSICSTMSYVYPRVDFLRDLHFKYHPFQKGFL